MAPCYIYLLSLALTLSASLRQGTFRLQAFRQHPLPSLLASRSHMGGLLSVPATVLLLGAGYVLLKVLINYLARSPLDNIPGPPSSHWLDGERHMETAVCATLICGGDRKFQSTLLSYRVGLLSSCDPQLRPCLQVLWPARSTECSFILRRYTC